MKRTLGIFSWIIALAGSIGVGLGFMGSANGISVIAGIIALILGGIGILVFSRKSSPWIEHLIDIIDIFELLG